MPVLFENPGIADLTAMTTMGVSAKVNTNPIGYFGTGFKYAIATLLRNRHKITLFLGQDEYEFFIERRVIRDEEFDIVMMRGPDGEVDLHFTTKLGRNWELWQAFRELHANALDEGGNSYLLHNQGVPDPANTRLMVYGHEFEKVFAQRHEIFLETSPIAEKRGMGSIHSGESAWVYYRNVRAYKLKEPSRFTYNLTSPMSLTEDRTLAALHEIHFVVSSIITALSHEQLLYAFSGGPEYFEHRIDATFMDVTVEQAEYLLNDVETGNIKIPGSVVARCEKILIRNLKFKTVELDSVRDGQLHKAITFCLECGYNVEEYKIKIVEKLGPGVLGMATKDTIYLTIACFDKGTATVAGTLLEEFFHLKHSLSDTSREFQNFLVDQLVHMGQRFTRTVL